MAFIQEAPFDLQTSDLPAPSANQRILYPVDDGSTTGKQWRARDDSEVLIVMLKHNYSATTAPGTGDDVDDGYSVGSIWVDTTNGNAYICEDNSTGAAVWLQINGGGGSSLPVDDTTSLVQDPSTNSKQMRIDVGNVADSTVRVLTMPDADVELFKDNLAASSAPTTGNDNTEGYAVGSYWIDTTNDKAYVCLDASTGAAVWTETTQSGSGSSCPSMTPPP
jgi:outer membrane protein assembly factor BamB